MNVDGIDRSTRYDGLVMARPGRVEFLITVGPTSSNVCSGCDYYLEHDVGGIESDEIRDIIRTHVQQMVVPIDTYLTDKREELTPCSAANVVTARTLLLHIQTRVLVSPTKPVAILQ